MLSILFVLLLIFLMSSTFEIVYLNMECKKQLKELGNNHEDFYQKSAAQLKAMQHDLYQSFYDFILPDLREELWQLATMFEQHLLTLDEVEDRMNETFAYEKHKNTRMWQHMLKELDDAFIA